MMPVQGKDNVQATTTPAATTNYIIPGTTGEDVNGPEITFTACADKPAGGITISMDPDTKINFWGDNPHREGFQNFSTYEGARGSNTVKEAKENGAFAWDLKEWMKKGSVTLGGPDGSEGRKDLTEKLNEAKNKEKETEPERKTEANKLSGSTGNKFVLEGEGGDNLDERLRERLEKFKQRPNNSTEEKAEAMKELRKRARDEELAKRRSAVQNAIRLTPIKHTASEIGSPRENTNMSFQKQFCSRERDQAEKRP